MNRFACAMTCLLTFSFSFAVENNEFTVPKKTKAAKAGNKSKKKLLQSSTEAIKELSAVLQTASVLQGQLIQSLDEYSSGEDNITKDKRSVVQLERDLADLCEKAEVFSDECRRLIGQSNKVLCVDSDQRTAA